MVGGCTICFKTIGSDNATLKRHKKQMINVNGSDNLMKQCYNCLKWYCNDCRSYYTCCFDMDCLTFICKYCEKKSPQCTLCTRRY
eukprot:UN21619